MIRLILTIQKQIQDASHLGNRTGFPWWDIWAWGLRISSIWSRDFLRPGQPGESHRLVSTERLFQNNSLSWQPGLVSDKPGGVHIVTRLKKTPTFSVLSVFSVLCYFLRQVSSFLNDKPRICKTSIKSSKKTESKPSWDPIYHEHFTISQRARTITSQSISSFAYLIFKWRMEIEAAQASSRGCSGCMWGRAGDAASWEHSPVIPELAKRQKLPTETKCVNKIIFPSFSNSYDLLWMQLWLETLRTTSRP